MKYAMLMGGLIGFCALFVIALLVGKTPVESLVQASCGSVALGLLFRWISMIWIRNVTHMLMERQQAAVAAMAEAEERKRQETKDLAAKPV